MFPRPTTHTYSIHTPHLDSSPRPNACWTPPPNPPPPLPPPEHASYNNTLQRRKFDEAESVLRQALSESPSNPPALVLLGRLRATTGKLDEAEKLYRVALEASPRNAPAHHALAKVFAFQQR